MAIAVAPLAAGGIHRDFEAQVLQEMQRHNASMHGCPIYKVESKLDGSIAFRFKGMRPGLDTEWEGGMKMNFPLLHQKKWLNDTTAVVESALKILAEIGARDRQPVIQRANA